MLILFWLKSKNSDHQLGMEYLKSKKYPPKNKIQTKDARVMRSNTSDPVQGR